MKNIATEADIEYYEKYINFGDRTGSVKGLKKNVVFVSIALPLLGILLSSSDWMNSLALRIVYISIMVSGIVGTIAADKWFSGNRGYLFIVCIGGAGLSITFILIGIFMVFGVSKILFCLFIIIQAVIFIMSLVKVLNFISNRNLPGDNAKPGKYYGLGGCFGYFGGILFSRVTEGVSEDMTRIILAGMAMVVPTLLTIIYVECCIKLYYAVKYKIEIVKTWDTKA